TFESPLSHVDRRDMSRPRSVVAIGRSTIAAGGFSMQPNWDYFSRHAGNDRANARRLDEARTAAILWRYAEALDGYMCFYEDTPEGSWELPSLFGSWGALATVYPRARIELAKIRDRKARSLRNGFRDDESFDDVVSIDKSLRQERATYELFVDLYSSS